MKTGLLVVVVALSAWRAEASCRHIDSCWCGRGPAELLETISIEADGGVTLRTEDGGVRYGVALEGEAPGLTSISIDTRRSIVASDGTIAICGDGDRVPAAVARVAASREDGTCSALLYESGLRPQPCNDVRSCSTTPGSILLLLGVWWRRRRAA